METIFSKHLQLQLELLWVRISIAKQVGSKSTTSNANLKYLKLSPAGPSVLLASHSFKSPPQIQIKVFSLPATGRCERFYAATDQDCVSTQPFYIFPWNAPFPFETRLCLP